MSQRTSRALRDGLTSGCRLRTALSGGRRLAQDGFLWTEVRTGDAGGAAGGRKKRKTFVLTPRPPFDKSTSCVASSKANPSLPAQRRVSPGTQKANPYRLFGREYALAVLKHVRARSRVEYSRNGRNKLFECLECCLPGARGAVSSEAAARTLGQAYVSGAQMPGMREPDFPGCRLSPLSAVPIQPRPGSGAAGDRGGRRAVGGERSEVKGQEAADGGDYGQQDHGTTGRQKSTSSPCL